MNLKHLIEGLIVLNIYYNDPLEVDIKSTSETIKLPPTDRPLSDKDYSRVRRFGWFQRFLEEEEYDVELGWQAITHEVNEDEDQ